jgi:two-component system sensor histidine kinase QseC
VRLNDAICREQRLTADAAHELRTPLSVIMLHAQNAIAASNDQDRNVALKELETGVMRVSRLLEQLLTLSKVSPETIPVDDLTFYPLCQEIMAQMALPILDKHQELELSCSEEVKYIKVLGSHFLLEILLRNLIDNAREYSPENGDIHLSIFDKASFLEVVVEDSGPGVKPEYYDRLTNRFYREHQNQGKGAGLGLSLVKSIVDFHHGELKFSQSSLGGLAISVSIPKSQV